HASHPFILISPSHTLPTLFFFTAPPPTEIYPLSLHDALPICRRTCCGPCTDRSRCRAAARARWSRCGRRRGWRAPRTDHCRRTADRKSTRLNSSHVAISYAVFCLKKKKKKKYKNNERERWSGS